MDFFFFANDVDIELAANRALTVSLALNLELFFLYKQAGSTWYHKMFLRHMSLPLMYSALHIVK